MTDRLAEFKKHRIDHGRDENAEIDWLISEIENLREICNLSDKITANDSLQIGKLEPQVREAVQELCSARNKINRLEAKVALHKREFAEIRAMVVDLVSKVADLMDQRGDGTG